MSPDIIDVAATEVREQASPQALTPEQEQVRQYVQELLSRFYATATGEVPPEYGAMFSTELVTLDEEGKIAGSVGYLFAVNYDRLDDTDKDLKLVIEALRTIMTLRAADARIKADEAAAAATNEAEGAVLTTDAAARAAFEAGYEMADLTIAEDESDEDTYVAPSFTANEECVLTHS